MFMSTYFVHTRDHRARFRWKFMPQAIAIAFVWNTQQWWRTMSHARHFRLFEVYTKVWYIKHTPARTCGKADANFRPAMKKKKRLCWRKVSERQILVLRTSNATVSILFLAARITTMHWRRECLSNACVVYYAIHVSLCQTNRLASLFGTRRLDTPFAHATHNTNYFVPRVIVPEPQLVASAKRSPARFRRFCQMCRTQQDVCNSAKTSTIHNICVYLIWWNVHSVINWAFSGEQHFRWI